MCIYTVRENLNVVLEDDISAGRFDVLGVC